MAKITQQIACFHQHPKGAARAAPSNLKWTKTIDFPWHQIWLFSSHIPGLAENRTFFDFPPNPRCPMRRVKFGVKDKGSFYSSKSDIPDQSHRRIGHGSAENKKCTVFNSSVWAHRCSSAQNSTRIHMRTFFWAPAFLRKQLKRTPDDSGD